MTNEEAETLIAEIVESAAHTHQHDTCDGTAFWPRVVWIESVEKIIKRFANKPSEDAYKLVLPTGVVICLNPENPDNDDLLMLSIYGLRFKIATATDRIDIGISIYDLAKLRDNCNKMIDYLEGE